MHDWQNTYKRLIAVAKSAQHVELNYKDWKDMLVTNISFQSLWLIKYSCKKSKVIEKVKVVSIAGKWFEITTVLMNLSPWQHLKLLWMHWIVCPVEINEDIPSIYRMGVHLAASIPQC